MSTRTRNVRRWLGIGLVAAAAAVFTVSAPAAAENPYGDTPGMYAYPEHQVAGTNLLFSTTVTQKPSRGANVFWAHQFHVNGNDAASGYIGIQTKENTSGQNLILFSVWGATGCETTGANGSHCVGDTDGESGRSVRIWQRWNANTEYRMSVTKIDNRPGWWAGRFIDTSTGQSTAIGNLYLGTSSTSITPMVSWVEYWNWGNPNAQCRDQENSAVTYRPMKVDGRTIPYASTSLSAECRSTSGARINPDGSATLTSASFGH